MNLTRSIFTTLLFTLLLTGVAFGKTATPQVTGLVILDSAEKVQELQSMQALQELSSAVTLLSTCTKDANDKLTVASGQTCTFSAIWFWGASACPQDNTYSEIEIQSGGTLNMIGCDFTVTGDIINRGGILNLSGTGSLPPTGIPNIYYTDVVVGGDIELSGGTLNQPTGFHMGATNIKFTNSYSKIYIGSAYGTNYVDFVADHEIFGVGTIKLQPYSLTGSWQGINAQGGTGATYIDFDFNHTQFIESISALNGYNIYLDLYVQNSTFKNTAGIILEDFEAYNDSTLTVKDSHIWLTGYSLYDSRPDTFFSVNGSPSTVTNITLENIDDENSEDYFSDSVIKFVDYNKIINLNNIDLSNSPQRKPYSGGIWVPSITIRANNVRNNTYAICNIQNLNIIQPFDQTAPVPSCPELYLVGLRTIAISGAHIETNKQNAIKAEAPINMYYDMNFSLDGNNVGGFNLIKRIYPYSVSQTLFLTGAIENIAVTDMNIASYIGTLTTGSTVTLSVSSPTAQLDFSGNTLYPEPCNLEDNSNAYAISIMNVSQSEASIMSSNTFGCEEGQGRTWYYSNLIHVIGE